MEIFNKLMDKYQEVKNSNLDENSMFKEFYDFLTVELNKLSKDDQDRFYLSFERNRKLKEILNGE